MSSLFGFIIMAFFFFVSKKKLWALCIRNQLCLGHFWKLLVFSALVPALGPLSPSALVFNFVGFERKRTGVPEPQYQDRAAAEFQTPKARKLLASTLYFMAKLTPLTLRKGKHLVCFFHCNQNHPGVPSQPSRPLLIAGAAVPLG